MALSGNVMLDGAKSTGHCFTPVILKTRTQNVKIESRFVGIRDDKYVGPHICGDKSHPPGTAQCRQNRVLVNGKPIHLKGDAISCGDFAAGPPSKTVIVGG